MSRPRTRGNRRSGQPLLIYGVTVGVSAFALMRGQLKWFSENGWEVMLACTPDREARLAAQREGVRLHGIPTERDVSVLADVHSLLGWIRFLRRQRPEAVNVGTPKAGLLGGLAAWLTKVPKRIYVVRGLRLEGTKGPVKGVLWLMERLSAAVATDVVVVSHSLAKELLSHRLVSPKKSWLIGAGSSNGVDAAAIAERVSEVDRRKLREDLGFFDGTFVVGFVGRVTKDKGVGTLIEAFQSDDLSKDLVLLLIGAVEDPDLAEATRVLGDRVRVLPWTQDIWGVLPAIDILCLPTLREGFPNVVLEAASAGIPTVTTRATGAIDSVIDGETGYLVEVNDAAALTEALNRFPGNPGLVHQLGSAAKTRAHEDYQPEKIWRGLMGILSSQYDSGELTRLDEIRDRARPEVTKAMEDICS